jgi:hypothetical protein
MRARLAAAAAGCVLIAVVIVAFSLSSHPVIAGDSAVGPVQPSVILDAGTQQCQTLSRVPRGANRVKLLVTYVTGGARRLNVEVSDPRGAVASGDLNPASPGERLVNLRPRTRAAHRARLCFSNPGQGRLVLGGDLKRIPGSPKGTEAQKQGVASAIFLRPGSSSWFAQTGTIADRYANSQTGLTGRWSLWLAVLFAVVAALVGIWSVVGLPGRPT